MREKILLDGVWRGAFGVDFPCRARTFSDCADMTEIPARVPGALETDLEAAGILPLTDALNIDLKCFREETYKKLLGGDLETVKRFIALAAERCHVELTTLIVPGMNDTEEEVRALTGWVASLPNGGEIPLHLTRFFPRYRVLDRPPTPVETV